MQPETLDAPPLVGAPCVPVEMQASYLKLNVEAWSDFCNHFFLQARREISV